MSDHLNIYRKIDTKPQVCNDMHMDNNHESQYQIFKNRLRLLQEYFPAKYSKKFINPCWYDDHQKPYSLPQKKTCATPLSYHLSLAQRVVGEAELSSLRHLYCLPSFFLSGFPKCASSTLYTMIVRHPQISKPRCKENHFWAQFVNQKGTDLGKKVQILHYLRLFSVPVSNIESNPRTITLDASVSYHIWNTESDYCVLPNLLMRVLPEAKFIVIMRNPSERVFSHYWYYSVRRKSINVAKYSAYAHSSKALKTFQSEVVRVMRRFQLCIDSGYSTFQCVKNKTIDGKDEDINGRVGLQTSMYYYHIAPWLSVFPRERFLFLRSEDLTHDLSRIMSRVWRFLNLYKLSETREVFAGVNEQVTNLSFPVQTKQMLDAFFQPYNNLLANLLSDTKYLWND